MTPGYAMYLSTSIWNLPSCVASLWDGVGFNRELYT